MVGLWGHATPTTPVLTGNGQIRFSVPEDEGFPEGTVFEGKLAGGELSGIATTRDGASWRWRGHRAPALGRKAPRRWGKPIRLFDGKDLAGWTFVDPTQAGAWSVENGTLVKHGRGSEIVTTAKYRDFKLHIEFNCGPMANSGVYLRGRYEVQMETNAAAEPPNRRIGAVYGFITPEPALARTPDVWQTYDITLIGRTVTVVHDGRTIIDRRQIPGITGGALDSDEGSPGPIYLQGAEDGRVAFRNIVITPAQ
jgi:3-keto-disaccharide hydrolase